jgi:hypothetical protein
LAQTWLAQTKVQHFIGATEQNCTTLTICGISLKEQSLYVPGHNVHNGERVGNISFSTGGIGTSIVGGISMTLIAVVVLALLAFAFMITAYHFKNALFLWGAAIFWLANIVYSFASSSTQWDVFYIIGCACGMLLLLTVAFMAGGMNRDKPVPEETELERYHKSENNPKTESMEDFKKRLGLKGRRNPNDYPPWLRKQ